eukprot:gene11266-15115_t
MHIQILLMTLIFRFIYYPSASFHHTNTKLSKVKRDSIISTNDATKGDVQRSAISNKIVQLNDSSNPYWSNGLHFSCTGCGKCCQNEGEVWLDTEEFNDMAHHLKLSHEEFEGRYVEVVMGGWVKLKSQIVKKDQNGTIKNERCIFLDEDGKKCTVYDVRPIQCKTYPYWPRLLSSPQEWLEEAVIPEDQPILPNSNNKRWSVENGGCEGINHQNATKVDSITIHRNHELYKSYNDAFPMMVFGDDKSKLFAKADVIQRVIKSSKAWVQDFVIKYDLCPFAESVFGNNKVKYRVFMRSSKEDLIERIKLELYYLLTNKADDIETTLLMLPFAFPDFKEFYEFSLEIEDILLPSIEKESLGPQLSIEINNNDTTNNKLINTKNVKKNRLINKLTKNKNNLKTKESVINKSNNEIQLAFFHPSFAWSDCDDFNDPMNFEKRAPFPTINLLRADKVRAYANEIKTVKIANRNKSSLENAGSLQLSNEFNDIIKLALE